ncbi:MAG: DUF4954 family protein [Chitinivibrionales bacterium]|nr:DUF4954 family protein [Chitinivibrionales bacterium]
MGRKLLAGPEKQTSRLKIIAENIEKSERAVLVLKAREGYHAYREMLTYYAVKNVLAYMIDNPSATRATLATALKGKRETRWANLGGQLMPESAVTRLRADIGSGRLKTWDHIHQAYDRLWERYPLLKARHAYATLRDLLGVSRLSRTEWRHALDEAVRIQKVIRDRVRTSRAKDFTNPFRQATYRSAGEQKAAIGTISDNSFVKQVKQETETFVKQVKGIKARD